MAQALSLPEQLALLALDPDRGRLAGSPTVYVAMAGGVVLELLAGGVAVVQAGGLSLVGPTTSTRLPTALQEDAVAAISAVGPRDVRHWVRHFSAPRFRLGQQVAAALAQRQVLRVQRERRFGLLPVQRQRLSEPRAREELLTTVRLALDGTDETSPGVRDLLVLAEAAGVVDRLVDRSQRTAARQRIERLTAQAASAGAVGRAVADVQAEVRAAVRRRRAAAAAAASGGSHGG